MVNAVILSFEQLRLLQILHDVPARDSKMNKSLISLSRGEDYEHMCKYRMVGKYGIFTSHQLPDPGFRRGNEC